MKFSVGFPNHSLFRFFFSVPPSLSVFLLRATLSFCFFYRPYPLFMIILYNIIMPLSSVFVLFSYFFCSFFTLFYCLLLFLYGAILRFVLRNILFLFRCVSETLFVFSCALFLCFCDIEKGEKSSFFIFPQYSLR